ncbi:MAG: hypothetical protein WBH40_17045 [Ignavibacteriaceae bacterium]
MKNKIILFYFLVIAVVFVLHALHLAVIAEDAFIGFRFAEHLAEGNGLLWNIGDAPVEGYTNFLWIIFCSVAILSGTNLLVFVQVAGIVFSIIILIYIFNFCLRLLEFDSYSSLIACAFLALAGPFATWSMSGMETNLFTLLVVASCYHEISYWKSRQRASLVLSFTFCFLATLTRPEGLGIFIILLTLHLYRALREKKSKEIFNYAVLALIIFVIPFLIYFSWRVSYFGYLFPLTFYAKTGGGTLQWIRGAKYSLFFIIHFVLPLAPLLILLFWEKLDRVKNMKLLSLRWFNSQVASNRYGIILCGLMCIAYSGYIVLIGGDYMAMYRFFVPVLPFIYVLMAAVYFQLVKDSGISKKRSYLILLLIVISLAGTFLQSTSLEKIIFTKPSITHGQYQGINYERWHTNRLSLIGKFFNNYKSSPDESLATDAIGAVSYYSDLKIYSIHGLVDPKIARMDSKDLGKGFPGHEKSDIPYTLSKKPTYFMFSRELTTEPGTYPVYSEEVNKILLDDYDLVNKWIVDEKNNESGYFTFLQRKVMQQK